MDIAYVSQSDIIPTRVLLEEVSKKNTVTHFLPTDSKHRSVHELRGRNYEVRRYNELFRFRGLSFAEMSVGGCCVFVEDIKDLIKNFDADIVVADEFYQPLTSTFREFCKRTKTPLVVNVRRNNTANLVEDLFFSCLARGASKRNLDAASRIVSLSRRGIGWLGEYFPDYAGKAVVVPNGIRVEDYDGGDGDGFRREHGIPLDKKVVLAVGRPHSDKRLDLCLTAFSEIKGDCVLVLVGVGVREAHGLTSLAYSLGIRKRVFFVGAVPHERMKDAYAMADVVVSTSSREPFGYSNLESLACGKPVVAFDVGGLCDIIDHGSDGFLVNFGDVRCLARCVTLLLGDDGLRGDFGRRGRKRVVEEFGLSNVADRLMGVYQGCTG